MNPLTDISRMKSEKADLCDKARKLEVFIADSPQFLLMTRMEQARLSMQLGHMIAYGLILQERINHAQDVTL